jgi:hypothetical protein
VKKDTHRTEERLKGRKRFARKDPPRTEPIRNWAGLLKPGETSGQSTKSTEERVADDPTARAINLAYRVIEENIAQGQRVTEKLAKAPDQLANSGAEIQEFFQRTLRYTADILPMWLDLMNSIASSDAIRRFLTPAAPAAQAPFNGTYAIAIEVRSVRPATISLELKPHGDPAFLMVNGLRSASPEVTPIGDVSFVTTNGNGRPCLRLAIPPKQPSGLYSGVVVRRDSEEPVGILTVRLDE